MSQILQITSINAEELESLIKISISDAICAWQKESANASSIPEYCTRKEVAALLRVSLPTVDDYIKRGMIPAVRVGGRIRIRRADIEKAMSEIKSIRYQRR